jgi:hypothetical protein
VICRSGHGVEIGSSQPSRQVAAEGQLLDQGHDDAPMTCASQPPRAAATLPVEAAAQQRELGKRERTDPHQPGDGSQVKMIRRKLMGRAVARARSVSVP